jgi:hypothetical protein
MKPLLSFLPLEGTFSNRVGKKKQFRTFYLLNSHKRGVEKMYRTFYLLDPHKRGVEKMYRE